jgi:hypothetical protein
VPDLVDAVERLSPRVALSREPDDGERGRGRVDATRRKEPASLHRVSL